MIEPLLLRLLRLYQILVSPVLTALLGPLGFGCRFTPTCSQYAIEAVRMHGPWRGTWLALRRLAHCHPWGPYGADPVPVPRSSQSSSASCTPHCGHGS